MSNLPDLPETPAFCAAFLTIFECSQRILQAQGLVSSATHFLGHSLPHLEDYDEALAALCEDESAHMQVVYTREWRAMKPAFDLIDAARLTASGPLTGEQAVTFEIECHLDEMIIYTPVETYECRHEDIPTAARQISSSLHRHITLDLAGPLFQYEIKPPQRLRAQKRFLIYAPSPGLALARFAALTRRGSLAGTFGTGNDTGAVYRIEDSTQAVVDAIPYMQWESDPS